MADIFGRLTVTDTGRLLAFQIAFDLYENATQQFIARIEKVLLSKGDLENGEIVEIENCFGGIILSFSLSFPFPTLEHQEHFTKCF